MICEHMGAFLVYYRVLRCIMSWYGAVSIGSASQSVLLL